MKLDAATFLLQWAAGGLAFLLGHDPAARGQPRLRLVAPGRLRRDGGRGRRAVRHATRHDRARPRPRRVGGRGRFDGRCARRCRSCAGEAVCAVARRCAPTVDARVAAMVGREATEMPDRERLAEFPPVLDLIAPLLGRVRAARGRAVRGWSVPARRGPAAGRRGVPRIGLRRDAARSLVPRAARPPTRAGEGARAVVRGHVAVRDLGVPVADRHGRRCSTAS